MKRKISVCFIIIMILTVYIYKSYGVISNVSGEMKTFDSGTNRNEDVLKYLKETYGYEGSTIPKALKAKGTLKIKAHTNAVGGTNGYDVYFYSENTDSAIPLNNTNPNVAGISEKDLKEIYGYPSDEIKFNESWDGVIIVNISEGGGSAQNQLNYQIAITKLYTGDDYEAGLNEEVDSSPAELPATEGLHEGQDNAFAFILGIKDFVDNFKHNKMGTIFTLLLDGSIQKIDMIQMVTNSFQTVELKTMDDFKIAYKYNFLERDGNEEHPGGTGSGAGNRNKFTNVSKGDFNKGDVSWQQIINVDINTTDLSSYQAYGFSNDTQIPVIVVDFYTLAAGKISAFDVNFLKIDDSLHNPDNSVWIKIRNVVVLIIRVTLYITSALLLTSLIVNAFMIIKNVAIEPKKRKKLNEGLINFAKACLMQVGAILIMAGSIYANEMFLPKAVSLGKSELPIRVNVVEAGYSFSTTDTGFVRYMAQIENVDLSSAKFGYVIGYLLLTLRNFLVVIAMLIRTILMFGLAIIGPITVLFYAFGKPEILPVDFKGWAKKYVMVAFIQVIIVFAYSVISII